MKGTLTTAAAGKKQRRNQILIASALSFWLVGGLGLNLVHAGGATSGSSGATQSTSQGQVGQGQATRPAAERAGGVGGAPAGAAIVLLPVQAASDERFANGCWVRFFDGENFTGFALTMAGPMEMPRMYPGGAFWRDWESAIVGPTARVTTFDEQNFRERNAVLLPAQRIPELRDHPKLGWFDEVHSARVACTN